MLSESASPQTIVAEPPPVLFLHIRKTAGSTLRNYLYNRFPASACLFHVHYGAYAQADPNRFQFVTGHLSTDYQQRFDRRPVTIVCLRDPLERALSHYYFWRSDEQLTTIRELTPVAGEAFTAQRLARVARMRQLSLLEFLRHEPVLAEEVVGNAQTRCLAGLPQEAALPAGDEAALLERAKDNLRRCELVLLTERLSDSIALLCRHFGWDGEAYVPHDNPTSSRPQVQELDAETRAALQQQTRLDSELYRFAQGLFQSRMQEAATDRGPRRTSPLPPCGGFTMDQPIHGAGWFTRERYDSPWFCWMAENAHLDLAAPAAQSQVLRVDIQHIIRPEAFQDLQVSVNDHPLTVTRTWNGQSGALEGKVPAKFLAGSTGRVRVGFRAGTTGLSGDASSGERGRRVLSVAVSGVRLSPAKRLSLFSFAS